MLGSGPCDLGKLYDPNYTQTVRECLEFKKKNAHYCHGKRFGLFFHKLIEEKLFLCLTFRSVDFNMLFPFGFRSKKLKTITINY